MMPLERAKTFGGDEDGAVTVDWVVLTAAVVGLGLAAQAVITAGVADLSGDISSQLTTYMIKTTF
ncbi:pilus assembly protein [Tropicimonas sediminicola]|uniref:pilus assembly protein n=1 Tax=Tropicimonas sediminicola TaxID=1031541 RepID=UPI000B770C7C|nr:pilus assembly protein [Tropicimonas sediminicola]